MSHLPRVLVLYRKSTYQTMVLEKKNPRYLELLEREDPTVRKLRSAHEEHRRCLDTVTRTLKDLKVPFRALYRAHYGSTRHYDLMITVGGDGTFLVGSHHLTGVPVLGVVSSSASRGHFCAASETTFPGLFGKLLEGEVPTLELQRLQVHIEGRPVPQPVLNEVLVCHGNPAATSRYLLSVGDHTEEQKSSGLWIATAAGSTAAIGSAGGVQQSPRDREFQYLVREPYIMEGNGYRLLRGILPPGDRISLAWKMERGYVYLDGSRIHYPIDVGDRVTVGVHPHPLRVYAPSERFLRTPRALDPGDR